MSYGYKDFSRIMNKKCLVCDPYLLKPVKPLWIDDDDDDDDDDDGDDDDDDDTSNIWDVM